MTETQPSLETTSSFHEQQRKDLEAINIRLENLDKDSKDLVQWRQALERIKLYIQERGADKLIEIYGVEKFMAAMVDARDQKPTDITSPLGVMMRLEPDREKRAALYDTLNAKLDKEEQTLANQTSGQEKIEPFHYPKDNIRHQRNALEAAKFLDTPTISDRLRSLIGSVLGGSTISLESENESVRGLVGSMTPELSQRLQDFLGTHREDLMGGINDEIKNVQQLRRVWEKSRDELVADIKKQIQDISVEVEISHQSDKEAILNDIREFAAVSSKAQTKQGTELADSGIVALENKTSDLHTKIVEEITTKTKELRDKLVVIKSLDNYVF